MLRWTIALIAALVAGGASAQEGGFGSLARLNPEASAITAQRGEVQIRLSLSQGVPFRIFTLDAPERLVVDFREVDWVGTLGPELVQTKLVRTARVGGFRPGWSRMVLELAGPFALAHAVLNTGAEDGSADLVLTLAHTSAEDFAAGAGVPPAQPGWDLPNPADVAPADAPRGEGGPLVVVLDPGHGGIDPGADAGGTLEKDLMLGFARELKEALLRAGNTRVVMTREDDSFVSLERRVSIAHGARADLFLSLHADSLGEGMARGATIYKLGADASDAASAALAERHNRADMLAGVDLSGTDDVVADVLMDLARMETQPRADLMARALVVALKDAGLPVNSRPLRSASFSVLKSPDIPSILLELGFLSNGRDLDNLTDPEWRAGMAQAIADAVGAWTIADAANARLVRQ
ncbi:N-acetylmuramoyl-L-alanine amidase [Pelagivirga sediminicola]|uniref:N-acetylmuramoyl-L-alanine amidase n=1 Tax=Pelagivirga sediminicola TaxID=2170575 RepID=A0A2T7GAI8_9RHOB|nr:N-acetylmuramoyl-L-alanine amidase [Pelagivirga sediminicola]PVA11440.1 N-acetylmuramoyl-L-alanine amidase [Pelagivirga sediminicola]